jgi:prepilin-type N-terminal cleavage/methylation domain-containing protein
MRRQRDPEAGFTMMEILVSLVVLVIGMLGIMALQSATVRGNRTSRLLERSKIVASNDGVTFTPVITVVDVPDHTNLKRVTVTVTFAEDGDSTSTRGATLEVIRNLTEVL